MVTRKRTGQVAWNGRNSYTYGSTAYKEAESIPLRRVYPTRETDTVRKKVNKRARQVALLAGLVLSLIFVNVALSELYFAKCSALVQLKGMEAQCLDQSETLQIDVERLHNPQRIAEIAEKKLGMSTARSNIYVRNP